MEAGPRGLPPVESSRPTLAGDRWMAVTGHPLTVQVAAAVLEAGGNAVDAGVAAGLATNVVQVDMSNLAGIAPIIVRPARSPQPVTVAGVGRWSSTATVEAYVARHGPDGWADGARCIVPGALAGWLSALDHFGTWSFADVAAPAVELATKGFVLDAVVASGLGLSAWAYERWPSSAAVYCPQGRHLGVGDRLVQTDLGHLLEQLVAAEGAAGPGADRPARLEAVRRAFYQGPVAQKMVDFVTAHGGFLTTDDLADFRAEVAPAPGRRFPAFGNLRVHTTPAEWSQGPALLLALAILARHDLAALGHNSPAYLHRLAETIKVAFSERERCFGDAAPVDLEALLAESHVAELDGRIRPDATLPDLVTLRAAADNVPSTTQVAVVDEQGNAFAVSPSDSLAGGPIVPGVGVMVSTRGLQSRTDPRHPAALGPGRRPRITPSPVIVVEDDPGADGGADADLVWPIACPGGDTIVQSILQAFLNVTVFGLSEQQAVEAPRAISLAYPNSFYPHRHPVGMLVVEDRLPEATMEELAALGHDVRRWPPFEFEAGSVGMIRQRPDPDGGGRPTLWAGADPRRAAYALGR